MEHIEVLETQFGSPDGNEVRRYQAGTSYLMPEDLATVFVREGWGRKVDMPDDPGSEGSHAAVTDEEEEREPDEGGDVDNGTQSYNVADAKELLADEGDADSLRALRRGEEQHPEFAGGRTGVLDAIDARLAELKESE